MDFAKPSGRDTIGLNRVHNNFLSLTVRQTFNDTVVDRMSAFFKQPVIHVTGQRKLFLNALETHRGLQGEACHRGFVNAAAVPSANRAKLPINTSAPGGVSGTLAAMMQTGSNAITARPT
jgi:hypothetical protein